MTVNFSWVKSYQIKINYTLEMRNEYVFIAIIKWSSHVENTY